jgi:psiF repeat
MRVMVSMVAGAFVLSLSLARIAGAEGKPLTAQQQKMATCSQQAKEKGLKGAERNTFMSDCLKAEKAAKNAQHEKMKDCNKQAAGKKGAERKAFMKECLSASHT